MNKFDIIATLNHHLLSKTSLKDLVKNGATIFRVNGSHIRPEDLNDYIKPVRAAVGKNVRILIDMPGNKIRTADLDQPIVLSSGSEIELFAKQLNYPPFLKFLRKGDVLLANDSQYRFDVKEASAESVTLLSYADGQLQKNKGIHLSREHEELPFFFERDYRLIEYAEKFGADTLGLSFVRSAADVEIARKQIKGSSLDLMVKVETNSAVRNLDSVLASADEFLVDRGDLSCDVGIENVAHFQDLILDRGKAAGKRVIFATQLLYSMTQHRMPLISEATAMYYALRAGVAGFQMSEETAIGKYPVEVLQFIGKMREAAAARTMKPGKKAATKTARKVYWLTGLSGSGKTTLARSWKDKLEAEGLKACLIDGDEFRTFWDNEAGFSLEDRKRNQRNIIFTAYQASQAFDVVIVASLSPLRELRALAREKIPGFQEVFVKCSLEACAKRDPQGHYKKLKAKKMKNFVGAAQDYEAPLKPELVIDTEKLSLAEAGARLHQHFRGDR